MHPLTRLASRSITAITMTIGAGCAGDDDAGREPVDPDQAPHAEIDRFSAAAGHLMVRDGANGLPGPNQPIDFDQGPFVTQGLGPDGQVVRYYNFDVQPIAPAPIYAFFRASTGAAVDGQLNVVDVAPGDAGYSDFWRVMRVMVPDDYQANEITSAEMIAESGYPIEETSSLVNCPVVPEGSIARERLGGGDTGLQRGWYEDQVVSYFTFAEKELMTGAGAVPVSPIFVTFNINPDLEGGGPGSGFRAEPDGIQTHNVTATVPASPDYSPLWTVSVYDNADFDRVTDLASLDQVDILAADVATVNCPIVAIE